MGAGPAQDDIAMTLGMGQDEIDFAVRVEDNKRGAYPAQLRSGPAPTWTLFDGSSGVMQHKGSSAVRDKAPPIKIPPRD